MSSAPLPIKLAKEPLIDVVFEIRFASSLPGSSFLPGLLYSSLPDLKNIEPLPISQLPQGIRDNDLQFKYSPLSRIWWKEFAILIGDRMIAIGCKMPYPGWGTFKKNILSLLDPIIKSSNIEKFERYSIKYTDFFPSEQNERFSLNNFNLKFQLGPHIAQSENLSIRIEIPRNGYTHAIQLLSDASIRQGDEPVKNGAMLDVDTIKNIENFDKNFVLQLVRNLDDIHSENKKIFFECLSDTGLKKLEPIYE